MVAIVRPGKASEKEKPLQLRAPFLQEPAGFSRGVPALSHAQLTIETFRHTAASRPCSAGNDSLLPAMNGHSTQDENGF